MNYRWAIYKIYKAIGSNNSIKSFWNEETKETTRFFISNVERDFFLEIYHRSTNFYELSVCDAQKFNPFMNRYSFKSLNELTLKLQEYKDKFTRASE